MKNIKRKLRHSLRRKETSLKKTTLSQEPVLRSYVLGNDGVLHYVGADIKYKKSIVKKAANRKVRHEALDEELSQGRKSCDFKRKYEVEWMLRWD